MEEGMREGRERGRCGMSGKENEDKLMQERILGQPGWIDREGGAV